MAFYTIHPREIEATIREKRAVLIDVREREAYLQDHYENARNCPYEEMDNWINRIPRNRVVLLYCEYGSTSLLAARQLGKIGIEAYTVVGGIHAIQEYIKEQERWSWPKKEGKCGHSMREEEWGKGEGKSSCRSNRYGNNSRSDKS